MAIKKPNKGINKKAIIALLIVTALLAVALLLALRYYNRIFAPSVQAPEGQQVELYIPSNPEFEEVMALLKHSGAIDNLKDFAWVARRKGYHNRPRGGRYLLKNGMSNNEVVNLLRAGLQSPINVTFNNIRTHNELAGQLAKRLEPDSLAFLQALTDPDLLSQYDAAPHTILGIILPNTYQMFWTTSPETFIERMHNEYHKFWNEERLGQADALRLTPLQIATLASIVDEETIREDEKPRVAGLYLNRLDRGMRLQADPTIKFAIGDFTVNRILTKDLQTESPYNTYLHAGLPPGPIRMPSISGINAVLQHEKHQYLYMCAKDDFSGYHAFARTLRQHNINAARYRQALNRQRIYR